MALQEVSEDFCGESRATSSFLAGMKVLFLGSEHASSTSRHRADALRRMGYDVRHLDPLGAFASRLRGNADRLHYHSGYLLLRKAVVRWLRGELDDAEPFDICWVDGGEMLGVEAVRYLKQRCGKVILFNHDDPTGHRDRRRFLTLRDAIGEYDLCAVVRAFNVGEFQACGARNVIRVFMTYDEAAHAPPQGHRAVASEFQSDIAFIGGNYKGERRDMFLAELIDRGLNIAIWGNLWQRSRVWHRLAPHWRGQSLSGQKYVDAIRGSKICLGLLSSRNRDEHTTRTMEIPFAGGLLCAQRTAEHEQLYDDGREAVFWSNLEECRLACAKLLADESHREGIRAAGMRRVRRNGVGNESTMGVILARAAEIKR